MRLLSCPKPEKLLEYTSISEAQSLWEKATYKLHLRSCESCQKTLSGIQAQMSQYLNPEPDITSSLINVYSQLQNDETLILKGWKLGNLSSKPKEIHHQALAGGWLFRGGVVLTMVFSMFGLILSQMSTEPKPVKVASTPKSVPFAQVRFQDENQVQVHYIRPELLQSVEFETTNVR